jgi:hypothetical protein
MNSVNNKKMLQPIILFYIVGITTLLIGIYSYWLFNRLNLPYEPISYFTVSILIGILYILLFQNFKNDFFYYLIFISLLFSLSTIYIGNIESKLTSIYDLEKIAAYKQFKRHREVDDALKLIYEDKILLNKEEWYFYSILNKIARSN